MRRERMEKIQRKTKIEKMVKLSKLMCLFDFKSPKDQLDDWVRKYKESDWESKTFDDKDVDLIIEALERLPGYSPERFLISGAILGSTMLENEQLFDFFLQIAYTFLSMLDPDLFEGEAFDGKIDTKD